ncbi:MAG: hypothetical protein IT379_27145 [Deltaproteobacteria bacterium]|nr:hypothetical protein [Deltaproteobacteria bacterium]
MLAEMRGQVVRLRAALLLALGACEADDAPAPPPSTGPAFRAVTEVEAVEELVDPAVGATLTLGGASLSIPAGALATPALIRLVRTTNPALELPEDDGALGGHTALWDSGFAIASDRQVALLAPLTLELPIDPSRLPADTAADAAEVSALTGGFLVVQGAPTSFSGSRLQVLLDPPYLPEGLPFTGAPRAYGSLPFQVVIGALAVVGPNIQAFIATIDSGRLTFGEIVSPHFRVRYRGSTTPSEAQEVADVLEAAHALYVDDLGFSLPRLLSTFTRYVVYLDDFANHTTVRGSPAGFTLPGSVLANGASYIDTNPTSAGNNRLVVAAHEYFHAVQYGAVARVVPNSFGKFLDPEATWLFEGTAALMGGRVAAGAPGPRLDRGLAQHPSPSRSIYEPAPLESQASPDRAEHPPEDVAQELFHFIELQLGHDDFYRPMFEGLGTDWPLGSSEPSVLAVDGVLRGLGTSLGEAYGEWVRDLLFDHPARYGGDPVPAVAHALDPTGATPVVITHTLPPLAYDHRRITVPAGVADAEDQPADLSITLQVTAGDPLDVVLFAAGNAGVEELQPLDAGTDELVTLFGVRRTYDRTLSVVVANRGTELSASASYRLTFALAGDDVQPSTFRDATRGILVYSSNPTEGTDHVFGRDLASGQTWEVELPVDMDGWVRRFVRGATPEGTLLVADEVFRPSGGRDYYAQALYTVAEHGRAQARELLGECTELAGHADEPSMDDDGVVYFLGEVMVEGRLSQALFRSTLVGCERLPVDLDGDGTQDAGLRALRVSREGLRLAIQAGDSSLYTLPASGGVAEGPFREDGRLVQDADPSQLAFADDGSGIGWWETYVPTNGDPPIPLGRPITPVDGTLLFAAGRFVWEEHGTTPTLVYQVPGGDTTRLPIPDGVRVGLHLTRSPTSDHVCFGSSMGMFCVSDASNEYLRLSSETGVPVYYP